MAKKAASPTSKSNKDTIPKTLDDHIFYGLTLDEDQKKFRSAIWNPKNLIVFCDAKAGSGKTLISVATGMLLVSYGLYDGVTYITSCTQEYKQGFLPGDLRSKSEPYALPLYDALIKINYSPDSVMDSTESQKNGNAVVEFMTSTYLRGRNFENRVVILDESQNYSLGELKKTLTRCHDSCKILVIGHKFQQDSLCRDNAFVKYINHFSDREYCQICALTQNHRGLVSNWADELEA